MRAGPRATARMASRRQHCLLLAAVLAAAVLAPARADEEPAGDGEERAPDAPFDPREAVAKTVAYQEAHPEFAAGIATWLTAGLVLLVTGTGLLLFSEFRAMLVSRDQDFRKRLQEQGYMEEDTDIAKLNAEENVDMRLRPYVSLIGVALIFVGIAALLYPLCDIITVLGLPATPCILIITFGAFFAAICVATFWMFLIWMCTRTAAALVLLTISLSGQLLIPTGNPILLLLWMLLAFGGGWAYFFWLPSIYTERPPWLQDIGNYQMSHEPMEILAAFEGKINAEAARYKPDASTLGAKEDQKSV